MENQMIIKKVVSSNICTIGHEGTTLYIQFHSGNTYSYSNVPLTAYQQLADAESVGKAFHRVIRGIYQHTLVEVEKTPWPTVLNTLHAA
jgi:hypothetical protein